MVLRRYKSDPQGVLSLLLTEDGSPFCVAIEHAYDDGYGAYGPKLPLGNYTCQLGYHCLHTHPLQFKTYEIEGVPNHTNILFHVGNTQADSDGCVLLGEKFNGMGVTESRATFDKFMALQNGLYTFSLSVK